MVLQSKMTIGLSLGNGRAMTGAAEEKIFTKLTGIDVWSVCKKCVVLYDNKNRDSRFGSYLILRQIVLGL